MCWYVKHSTDMGCVLACFVELCRWLMHPLLQKHSHYLRPFSLPKVCIYYKHFTHVSFMHHFKKCVDCINTRYAAEIWYRIA